MKQLFSVLSALITSFTLALAGMASASDTVGLSKVELRPGWRMADGTHMAALHIVLEPGWKTYWRAPGDVGIPPQFDWSQSRNIKSAAEKWPTPDVFFEQESRSVGYKSEVIIPIQLTPIDPTAELQLIGDLQIGVCKDICIPAHLTFSASLKGTSKRPDPVIAAALSDRPYSAREAGVKSAICRIAPGADGALFLHSEIEMPTLGGTEHVVVEAGNPLVWVAEPDSRRSGNTLYASTSLLHVEGRSFALNRSDIRFTILGNSRAVDILGCTS